MVSISYFEIFDLPSNITYNNWLEANVYSPIYSTDSGIIIEINPEDENAWSSMCVTVDGILIDTKL